MTQSGCVLVLRPRYTGRALCIFLNVKFYSVKNCFAMKFRAIFVISEASPLLHRFRETFTKTPGFIALHPWVCILAPPPIR